MARSKIKGTKGKPVKKAKNKDKLKASINIRTFRGTPGDGKVPYATSITQKNDGWNHVNHTDVGPNGTTKTKIKGVEGARKPLKGQGYGASKTDVNYKPSTYHKKRKELNEFKKGKRHETKYNPNRK
jgi:hypothetical protein